MSATMFVAYSLPIRRTRALDLTTHHEINKYGMSAKSRAQVAGDANSACSSNCHTNGALVWGVPVSCLGRGCSTTKTATTTRAPQKTINVAVFVWRRWKTFGKKVQNRFQQPDTSFCHQRPKMCTQKCKEFVKGNYWYRKTCIYGLSLFYWKNSLHPRVSTSRKKFFCIWQMRSTNLWHNLEHPRPRTEADKYRFYGTCKRWWLSWLEHVIVPWRVQVSVTHRCATLISASKNAKTPLSLVPAPTTITQILPNEHQTMNKNRTRLFSEQIAGPDFLLCVFHSWSHVFKSQVQRLLFSDTNCWLHVGSLHLFSSSIRINATASNIFFILPTQLLVIAVVSTVKFPTDWKAALANRTCLWILWVDRSPSGLGVGSRPVGLCCNPRRLHGSAVTDGSRLQQNQGLRGKKGVGDFGVLFCLIKTTDVGLNIHWHRLPLAAGFFLELMVCKNGDFDAQKEINSGPSGRKTTGSLFMTVKHTSKTSPQCKITA